MGEIEQYGTFAPVPSGKDGTVFGEPWEAQAFAIVLKLHEAGHFTWAEWTAYLADELRSQESGETYYQNWLCALERLSADKGLVNSGELADRRAYLEANPPSRHDHHAKREPVKVA
jgi:nitrile hydratase accessory protein